MEADASNKTENIQSSSVIIDVSDHASSSSNNDNRLEQSNDNDYKTSVDEAIIAVVNQVNWTKEKINGLNRDAASSNLPTSNQESISNISSMILEQTPMNITDDPQPNISSPPQSQVYAITTDNSSQQLQKKKHIMISYNHATASIVCKKIYDRLKERNYNVWFDIIDLHGSVFDAMGDAVDNSYVLLLCMNERYSKSAFCRREAKYAAECNIPVIPCMMEETFRPRSGLGIIKGDLKHIEFFDEDKFEEKFEELINEINAIERGLGMRSDVGPVNSNNFREYFNAFITEHVASIENSNLRRENLDERDFGKILFKLFQRLSPETLQSFQNEQSNDINNRQNQERDNNRLIQYLLEQNKNLEESARIEQENYARHQQQLLKYDERLAAFVRFQEQQEQNKARDTQHYHNQREHLTSLFRDQIEQQQQQTYTYLQQQLSNQNQQIIQLTQRQQEQERNARISEQLLQHVERLTDLVVMQQQQHAKQTESLHQLVHESLKKVNDQSSTSTAIQQQQQRYQFNLNLFNKLIETIILLYTLIVLLKNK